MEEAEREEEEEGEEEEEESPKELELEEEEIAMAVEGLGFLCYWLWEEEGIFAVKKSRFGAWLNSEKMEDGSAVFTFYEEPVAEMLRLPWWLQCV